MTMFGAHSSIVLIILLIILLIIWVVGCFVLVKEKGKPKGFPYIVL